ncbi:glycosyltransferase family 2 protein [Enterocloster citroniae]
MTFSVVVPVHNAELYLNECIESVLRQSYLDFELILVINASVDQSLCICEAWADKDSRIKLLVTEEAGVSNARNLGIELACGDWFVFLDADDYLMNDALELLEKYVEPNIDLVVANYIQDKPIYFSNKITKISAHDYILAMLDHPMYFKQCNCGLTWNAGLLGVNWAKAFKAAIIKTNKIRFETGLSIFEDLVFNLSCLKLMDQIKCIDAPVYYYRITGQSLSRSSTLRSVKQRLDYMNYLQSNKNTVEDEKIRQAFEFQIGQNVIRTFVIASQGIRYNHLIFTELVNFTDHPDIRKIVLKLRRTRLSQGKIQSKVYTVLLYLIKQRMYTTALLIGNTYSKLKNKD